MSNSAANRYGTICVPGRVDEDAGTWFVFDRLARRSVLQAASYDHARDTARQMNSALDGGTRNG